MVTNVRPWTNSTDNGSINNTQFFSALGNSVRTCMFPPYTSPAHECPHECALFMLTAFTAREQGNREREREEGVAEGLRAKELKKQTYGYITRTISRDVNENYLRTFLPSLPSHINTLHNLIRNIIGYDSFK